jgi:hypothetical protein
MVNPRRRRIRKQLLREKLNAVSTESSPEEELEIIIIEEVKTVLDEEEQERLQEKKPGRPGRPKKNVAQE